MDINRTHTLLTDFIPIFKIYLFTTLPKETALFFNSVLGKLFAVSLILYYTQKKLAYGLFLCSVFLFYYQSGLVENILNDDWRTDPVVIPWNTNTEGGSSGDDLETFSVSATAEKAFVGLLPFDTTSVEPFLYTPFTPVNAQNEDILRGKDKKEELKAIFRKEVCVNGKPQWKGHPIRPEMADHVFREIEMGDKKCNPCDVGCDFNIIEERLASEEKLVRPKSSKDATEWSWDGLQNTLHSVAALPHLFAEHWGELTSIL